MAILQIQGKDYKFTAVPLKTVRPFIADNLILADEEAALDEPFGGDGADQNSKAKEDIIR